MLRGQNRVKDNLSTQNQVHPMIFGQKLVYTVFGQSELPAAVSFPEDFRPYPFLAKKHRVHPILANAQI